MICILQKDMEKKRILVVDDSIINLKIVEAVLKNDYQLKLVQSGEEALAYLTNYAVDLVLLDIMMPDKDGYEVFEEIKKLDNNQNVPVIFLTADSDADTEIKGLEMGAVDFIRKPFVPAVMVNRIQRILQLDELTKNLEGKVIEKTNQIKQLSFEIIATIASMIEAKDSYTKGHSLRVAEYSGLLAQGLGWSDAAVQNLKYIALLHDIGKVGVPDNVLNKPGKLTEAEYNIIKSHTTIGGEILKDIETIEYVDSGAKYHHERYDGKGYPCGLLGKQIPDVARIIGIADAYDAMSSKRIYRDSLAPYRIRQELENGRGTQFDPEYLDVFLQLFDEGKLVVDKVELNREKTLTGESSALINQIMKSIEEEAQKTEAPDYLTGLLNRKNGEEKIAQAMKEAPGCLAFVDLDNLKRTNDTMGHLAGDYALTTVGEVLTEFAQNAIVARLGGDEFLYYMCDVDWKQAIERIEAIQRRFVERKEESVYLSVSSLSVGMCITSPKDEFDVVLKNADKALYQVKRSGKCGYRFYEADVAGVKQKSSVDLERLVNNLKQQEAQSGALKVEYREFAKIYDFVCQLKKRYQYRMQLVMLTLNSLEKETLSIDEKEYAMNCMEKTIQSTLRTVDVSTRFGGEQFLIILMNVKPEEINIITTRIFEQFFKVYDKGQVEVQYDIADLGD